MKKKSLIALAGLLGVLAVGGTFAYFNVTLTAQNELKTKGFSSELVEKFTPGNDWKPGQEVTKEVGVENTGDYDVIARLTWDELWTNANGPVASLSLKDENLETPSSKVIKNLTTNSDWVYGGDGYYYYTEIIAPKKASGAWLDSITLSPDLDLGGGTGAADEATKYYTKAADKPESDAIGTDPATQWVKYDNDKPVPDGATYVRTVSAPGSEYANASYSLDITIQVLQATKEAVDGEWMKAAEGKVLPTTESVVDFLNAIPSAGK